MNTNKDLENALDNFINPDEKDFNKKVKEQKTMWQFVNIALPIFLVVLFGFGYQQLRKRKYAA